MKKTMIKFVSLLICMSVLAAMFSITAFADDKIGLTIYEQFDYKDEADMLSAGWVKHNDAGNFKLDTQNNYMTLEYPGSATQNRVKYSGFVPSRTYTLEMKMKLTYGDNPTGNAALVIYDGTTRNDYRFVNGQLNHRNGSTGKFVGYKNAPHTSDVWYTYRFVANNGTGSCYRKAEGESEFTEIFKDVPFQSNTTKNNIDLFVENATTTVNLTVDYLKMTVPFTGTLGTDNGIGKTYLNEGFDSYSAATYTQDSESLKLGKWNIKFVDNGKVGHSGNISVSNDGILTMNANGDTKTIEMYQNTHHGAASVAETRVKIDASSVIESGSGLGIQYNNDTDRIFIRLQHNLVYYLTSEGKWINVLNPALKGEWMNIRFERINDKVNVYAKPDSLSEYVLLFGNIAPAAKTATNTYYIDYIIEKSGNFKAMIDNVTVRDANAFCPEMSLATASNSETPVANDTVTATYKGVDTTELHGTAPAKTLMGILAFYTSNNELITIKKTEIGTSATTPAESTIPMAIPANTAKIKTFLWSDSGITPVINAIEFPKNPTL